MSSKTMYEEILEKISKYSELNQDEVLELYDKVDELYNNLLVKYLEALVNLDKNKDIVDRILDLARKLLTKENRDIEEELILIAILDIMAEDLFQRASIYPSSLEEENN